MGARMDARDELDIRNLIARVAWMTDNWTSIEEYLLNYHEDATWEIEGHGQYQGHEGIGRRVQEMLDQGVCGPGLPARHSVTSLEVIPDDVDPSSAVARSFGVMISTIDGEPVVVSYGQKHDYVRKGVDGVWRVSRRVIGVQAWEEKTQAAAQAQGY
jgi:hypothetical protein